MTPLSEKNISLDKKNISWTFLCDLEIYLCWNLDQILMKKPEKWRWKIYLCSKLVNEYNKPSSNEDHILLNRNKTLRSSKSKNRRKELRSSRLFLRRVKEKIRDRIQKKDMSLNGLLSSSSPYHKEFMPVYQAISTPPTVN